MLVASGAAAHVVAGPSQIRLVVAPDAAGISFIPQHGDGTANYITEQGGTGAAWIDYDVDGDIDAFLVNGLPEWGGDPAGGNGHSLFRNHDGQFLEAPGHTGIGDRIWGAGVAVADVDYDGFPDLLVTAIGPDRLYLNNGDGTFTATPAGVEDDGWGTSALFTDWNRDGFVDLYVARYVALDTTATPSSGDELQQKDPSLDPFAPFDECFFGRMNIDVYCDPNRRPGLTDLFYRNAGDGTFEPWFEAEVDPRATPGWALVATDCDNDLLPEIYVANDLAINLLYRRTDDGGIEDWALFSGAGYSGDGREQAGMAATSADVDGDGMFDLFVTNFQADHNTFYRNLGDCSFEDATARYGLAASGIPFMGWGALFVDLDGDADEDLFVANGHLYPQLDEAGLEPYSQRNLLYSNQLRETGVARFVEVGGDKGDGMLPIASSRATIRGDYDNDGDVDILVTNVNAPPTLLRNDGAGHAPTLQITLIGRSSNRTGYGAQVRLESGDIEQLFELRGSDGYLGSNDARLLFHRPGGSARVIEIAWPNGHRTTLRGEGPARLIVDEAHGVVARRLW